MSPLYTHNMLRQRLWIIVVTLTDYDIISLMPWQSEGRFASLQCILQHEEVLTNDVISNYPSAVKRTTSTQCIYMTNITIRWQFKEKTIVNIRLRPRCCHVAKPTKQRRVWFRTIGGALAPLCENMTSSTKPEVHYLLHCHLRRTEPQP